MRLLIITMATALTTGMGASDIAAQERDIDITRSLIVPGSINVRGRFAPPETVVFWEGQDTDVKTTARGTFRFNTTVRPADCVGRLKIGDKERDVVVGNCAPQGEKGDRGERGYAGDKGDKGDKGDSFQFPVTVKIKPAGTPRCVYNNNDTIAARNCDGGTAEKFTIDN